ncbi:hypothetical protein L3C95_34815, partial [Chitinophaga filiformis]|uniref:hypothetical protein n=1 Tax=Chitinophaga filiformis TaxID=104663 RepID=UPI001F3C4A3D
DDRKESRKLRMESCPARATLEAKGYQGALNDILKEGKKQGDRGKKSRRNVTGRNPKQVKHGIGL